MSDKYTYNFGADLCKGITDFTDKEANVGQRIAYMLNRTQAMIEYRGLPDTIPARALKLMLQVNGWTCIPDPKYFDGKMYAFVGGLGGEPNPYYMPTKCTVANPALKFSRTMTIGEDCVIIPHDSMYMGLIPLLTRYISLLAENDLSMRIACINSRIVNTISASDDRTLKSAKQYLKDIESGKLGTIAETAFLDGVKIQPGAAGGNSLTNLIEFQQYLQAGMFNEIGLNANYNMKREAINTVEAQLNDDALLPLIDNIIETQETAFDELNAKGWSAPITPVLGSAWEDRQIEQNIQLEGMEEQEQTEEAGGEEDETE